MYPNVDITQFTQSAKAIQKLFKDATAISSKIANDPVFAKQLMEKAQQSKQEEVQKQLQSIGIGSEINISFNPNTIHITLSPKKASRLVANSPFFFTGDNSVPPFVSHQYGLRRANHIHHLFHSHE